jgi:hypothetical protein
MTCKEFGLTIEQALDLTPTQAGKMLSLSSPDYIDPEEQRENLKRNLLKFRDRRK